MQQGFFYLPRCFNLINSQGGGNDEKLHFLTQQLIYCTYTCWIETELPINLIAIRKTRFSWWNNGVGPLINRVTIIL